ncbi:hypothetical protein ABZ470_39465 [Streptosporangium sp. NPDC020072]|uniref:hypothetical protein n=1 Tax=Streptosporangium sp. NPDC020072 TaxID=3154788 RepID=UPI00341A225B
MQLDRVLPTTPGALLGYRKDGVTPIYLIAGGSGEDDEETTTEEVVVEPGPEPDLPVGGEREKAKPDARTIDDLPSWAQKELRRARTDAVNYRTKLQEAQAAADAATKAQGPNAEELMSQAQQDLATKIGQALGLLKEEEKPLDPQEVINRLTSERDTTAQERDAERDLHRRAMVELAVHKASGKLGADPEALLDSRSFLRNINDLDPAAEGFQTSLDEVITSAVEHNPKFKAQVAAGPPARSGGDFTGGSGGRSSDPEQMSIDDFRARRKKKSSS